VRDVYAGRNYNVRFYRSIPMIAAIPMIAVWDLGMPVATFCVILIDAIPGAWRILACGCRLTSSPGDLARVEAALLRRLDGPTRMTWPSDEDYRSGSVIRTGDVVNIVERSA
jgi:hypothetical protein